MSRHTPVLAEQVIQFLNPRPGGFFIDATVGAGGHSRVILELTAPDGKLLAIDQDESALAQAGQELAVFGPRVVFVHANFREVALVAAEHGFSECDGVLADIGISSMMVDDPSRGFSFMREGPLDMRMDRTQPLTAAEVLNTFSEKDIAGILFHYGEERRSRAIARANRCDHVSLPRRPNRQTKVSRASCGGIGSNQEGCRRERRRTAA